MSLTAGDYPLQLNESLVDYARSGQRKNTIFVIGIWWYSRFNWIIIAFINWYYVITVLHAQINDRYR